MSMAKAKAPAKRAMKKPPAKKAAGKKPTIKPKMPPFLMKAGMKGDTDKDGK